MLAGAGLPADTPLSLRIGRVGPPDPLETGNAYLELTLIDSADGGPCSSLVVLWRIGAPRNALWTSGDQDVAEVFVDRPRYRFGPIAAGEYRMVCSAEDARAPQQAPYHVAGVTSVTLRLQRPEARPALLVPGPDQEAGSAALQAKFGPALSRSVEWRKPSWVVPRSLHPNSPWDYFEEWSNAEGDPVFESETWTLLLETPSGHELGPHPGDTRARRIRRRIDLRRDGDPWGAVVVENSAAGPRIFVPYPQG